MYKDENTYYTLCKKDGRRWGYYWYDKDGKRHFRSTGRETKHEAMKVINERIRNGELGFFPEDKPVTFREYTEDFFLEDKCRWVKERRRTGHKIAASTLYIYRRILEGNLVPYFGDRQLKNIDKNMIRRYEDRSVGEGKSLATVAGYSRILSIIMGFAKSEDKIDKDPFDSMQSIVGNSRKKNAFTLDQVRQLLSCKWDNEFYKKIFMFACLTGLRVGEIQGLKVKYVHDDYIEIVESYSHTIKKQKDTKNHKSRVIPFPDDMREDIEALCKGKGPDDIVFRIGNKDHFSRNTLYSNMKGAMELCGIPQDNLSFHSTRHFFDTYLYVKAGVDKEKIREVIGHSSDEMFRHYLHIQAEDLDEVRKAQSGIMKKETDREQN